jgi:hypothetical protein
MASRRHKKINKKRKQTRRRIKKQKGGSVTAQIALFTEKEVDPKDLVETLEKTFGSLTQVVDAASLSKYKSMFKETSWGYKPLPPEEKKFLYLFSFSSPPPYLLSDYPSKKPCIGNDRLTRLEGEIGNALLADHLEYRLIPRPHGLYGHNFFLVGLRVGGETEYDKTFFDSYVKHCEDK